METVSDFWLTRLVFQRAMGVVYLIAFIIALNQFRPLLGEHGLEPVGDFIRVVPFRRAPSLFYLFPKDAAYAIAAWMGIALSTLVVVGVVERLSVWLSAGVWALMWLLYLSFVNVGQTFYGFGWESILLEAGFYATFLGPRSVAPPTLVIWMLRWLVFRVMFGAGMIKMRGDPCWMDLSCLNYHYETQPMPNPLSWFFHWTPAWTHRAGVAFNHVAELVVPFGYFAPGPVSAIAGVLTMVFQGTIMASGNLSFLNFLTIVLAIPALNDRWLAKLLPIGVPAFAPPGQGFAAAVYALAIVVGILSIAPIRNLFSSRQIMNTNFNPFHLVGTYGAFGGITRTRYEIIIEGTADAALTPATEWRAYEFKGKPGDPSRLPPQIAPYHLRLDWLMWFAAMDSYQSHPWFVHLLAKLLQNDRAIIGLLKNDPFPNAPPRFIRAELYEYHFTTPEERRQTGRWWTRRLEGTYFPPVSLDTPGFHRLLEAEGWL